MHRANLLLLVACFADAVVADAVVADDVTFEADVRPILKAHCFQCHGEAGEREGELDLRLRRLIATGGESGAAIVAGDADASLLLERVRSGEMPPGDKRLDPKQIQVLADWIASGAKTAREEPDLIGDGPIFTDEDRNYWAFQPAQRPIVPEFDDARRVRTPIDALLLQAFSNSGVKPAEFASDATKERLIRRAYFDLIGLPPSPDAVAAFVGNASSDAWEQLIDELLASEHYGERWGRHWLDVAGYADSEGYSEEDRERPHAFRYRDYVIRAFNGDKPFDVFIQEQLAGDEMVTTPHDNSSPETIERLTATGFLRMAPDGTASGGIDKSAAQNQVMADTLQIVGSALLGLTVNCAQCHDHRYDPIPTRDYYRLRAIFEPALDWKNWRTPAGRQISLYTDADRKLAAEFEAEAVVVEKQRQEKADGYITRTLEEELRLVPVDVQDTLRTAYRTVAKDRNDQQKGLLKEYPSVASISVGSLYLYDRRRSERAAKLDADRKAKTLQYVSQTVQQELLKVPASDRAAVQAAVNVKTDQRTADQIQLLQRFPGVLVTATTLSQFNPERAVELARYMKDAAELRNSKASDDLKKFADSAAEIRGRKPKEGFLRCLTEQPDKVPATLVFYRGDHEQPKEAVQPGGLSILGEDAIFPENDPSLPTTGRRLAFAKYLTNGQHPLFARVIVNRIWLHHFGTGLVGTAGDFGVLGDQPTHPQLLDWLAAELVDSGWSVKHIHRMVMRSTVYRQGSQHFDPDSSVQYSKYPVRRLESEIIRDAVLSVCGLLNEKMYGESVPVMEDSVGQIVLGKENLDGERKPTKATSLDGEEFRRSVYIQVRRSRTLSMFETFDAPTLSPNCEQRSFSTVTPQALLMMNSDFAVTYADAFAKRVLGEAPADDEERVKLAWQLAYSAKPSRVDVAAATQFIRTQRAVISGQSEKKESDSVDHEAFAVFCQALFSSSRFLYVD
ncbi:MAG: PSD1 and planctomycete cytochrome C domain-containing protein [Fuerstiella sp.]